MLTLNMLIQEGTPNFLGVIWPKGTFDKLIEMMSWTDAKICVFERLCNAKITRKDGKKQPPERGKVIAVINGARMNGNFVECDIDFTTENEWMESTFTKEGFSLNSEIEADLDENNIVKLKSIALRALSIVETIPQVK